MASIFVSYAREDRRRVEPFVDLLTAQGWTVWWDRALVPGHTFEDVIDEEIQEARCVVVFWSKHSVTSEWVLAEAHDGFDRGILVPVLLDEVRVPLVFRRKQAGFLLDWPEVADDSEVKRIIGAIGDVLKSPPTIIDTSSLDKYSGRPSRLRRVALVTMMTLLVGTTVWYLASRNSMPVGESTIDKQVIAAPQDKAQEFGLPLPATSITILPFEGADDVLSSLSYEIGDILRGIEDIYVTSIGQTRAYSENAGQLNVDSRYLVTGEIVTPRKTSGSTGANSQTIQLRVVDRQDSSTVWQEDISVKTSDLEDSANIVAARIAARFDKQVPKAIDREQQSTEVYLQYLTAKAESRKPATIDVLNRTRELFEVVIEADPRFAEARAGLCDTYINLYVETRSTKQFEKAEQHCHRAHTLSAGSGYVHSVMGRLYSVAGEYVLAEEHFNQALKMTPYSTDTMRGLAKNYEQQKLFEKAERVLLQAIAIEPNYWTNYQALASIYFLTGDYEKAAQFYSNQADLVIRKAKALNNLGAAYYLLEEFELAIGSWEQSLVEDPTPQTYANLGSAYFFNHQYSNALASYQSAVDLSPDDHRLWGSLGEALLFSKGDYRSAYRKAIELVQAQLVINTSDSELLSSLATYYATLGDEDESLKYLDKAMSFAEDDVYTVYDAAVTHSRLGNKKEVGRLLELLVEMGYSESLINRDANFKNLE